MKTWSFPSVRRDGLILIVGLGETGVAAARWCARHGAMLRILDTRPNVAGAQDLRDLPQARNMDFRLGPEALATEALEGVNTLVLSPGLSPLQDQVQVLLQAARDQGIEVIGEIELFARALKDMSAYGYVPKVLAVTGTNGKTTVTAMTRQLAQASGYQSVAAGNISPAALTALGNALDAGVLPEVWVLELSSFQLETTFSLQAHAAVVLNISQDHLDWHGSYQAYINAKASLLQQAALVVINRDDDIVRNMVADCRASNVCTFGDGLPEWDGDLGLELNQGVVWLCAAQLSEDQAPPVVRRGSAAQVQENELSRSAGGVVRLMPADALRVRGRHNALNALAAMALVRALGAGWAAMLHALRDYGGEPHRLEFVRNVAGVDFINDSKGTNVAATMAALDGLDGHIVLIAGGLTKGQDFQALAQLIHRRGCQVVLLGQDAGLIAAALAAHGVTAHKVASLDDAVRSAFALARAGDMVLLSPACASMDMFKNYVHRGQCFVDSVQELALDQGEVA